MESYTTRDVARLLGISEAQVRSHARAGFLSLERGPRNSYRFSFQDLVLLRTARNLAGSRVPPRRIKGALCKLARDLPKGRSLSELQITSEDYRVVVVEDGTAWNPESEQFHFDLLAARAAHSVARSFDGPTREAGVQLTAAEWFDLGDNIEDSDPGTARDAYLRALGLDPNHADAHVNLGRLLQLEGRVDEAMVHYRSSIQAAGTDPTASFNLGTALEMVGRWGDSLKAYQRALKLDPDFSDAHFNLSRLCEQLGHRTAAIRHLHAYQRLVNENPRRHQRLVVQGVEGQLLSPQARAGGDAGVLRLTLHHRRSQ
jgi:DNA-binding transcriptional MerR regulator